MSTTSKCSIQISGVTKTEKMHLHLHGTESCEEFKEKESLSPILHKVQTQDLAYLEREKGLCQVLTLAEDGLTYKMQNNKVHQELRQQNSANINRTIPDSAKMLDLTSVQTQYKHCTAP